MHHPVQRSVFVDSIRIIAIALILVAHIAQTLSSPVGNFFGIKGFYWVSIGGVAVTLFLIISGCSLQLVYGSKKINYGHFVAKRLVRIYPVYWIVVIIGILIYFALNHFSFQTMEANLTFKDIPLSICGFYAFVGQWGGPFVATSWFIGVIIFFYFLFPLISICIKRYPTVSIVFFLLVSFISRWFLFQGILSLPYRPIDWFPPCRIFEFGLGVYFATIIPYSFWFNFKLNHLANRILVFMAELSFPVFLAHFPLLCIIKKLIQYGLNPQISVLVYFISTFLLSWIIMSIDQYIHKRFDVSFRHNSTTSSPSV